MPQKRTRHTPHAQPYSQRRTSRRTGKQQAVDKHSVRRRSAHSAARKHPGRGLVGNSPAVHTRTNTRFSQTKTPQAIGSGFASSSAGSRNEFSPEVVLSRRNLLIGAAGIAGVALAGGIGSAVVNAYSDSDDSAVDYISVPESAVTDLSSFDQIDAKNAVSLVGSFRLGYNTLAWVDNDSFACCLVPGDAASPLNTVELFSLSSGYGTKALSGAQGTSEGFEIFDARCSEDGLIWTECNVLENRWRIYTAALSGRTPENITLVDEGDATWLTPSIAAVGNTAFWQVAPQASTKNVPEGSGLKAVRFTGGQAASTIYESNKAFATRVTPVSDGVVITPRANTSGVYYQLVKINESSLEAEDSLTLPVSMKPYEATWGNTGFAFAFENIYNYGGGIANLGTYTPLSKPQSYLDSDTRWLHFTRAPSSTPSWCGDFFVVKSTRAICGINTAKNQYFMIDTPSFTDDYGEYLVSSGSGSYIAGLSQITNPNDSSENHALLRLYSPL